MDRFTYLFARSAVCSHADPLRGSIRGLPRRSAYPFFSAVFRIGWPLRLTCGSLSQYPQTMGEGCPPALVGPSCISLGYQGGPLPVNLSAALAFMLSHDPESEWPARSWLTLGAGRYVTRPWPPKAGPQSISRARPRHRLNPHPACQLLLVPANIRPPWSPAEPNFCECDWNKSRLGTELDRN